VNGIAAYKANTFATQGRVALVVKLYEGAIRYLRLALDELESGQIGEKAKLVNKAAAIVEELNGALDMAGGGEIAANLRGLYTFMLKHLLQANIHNDATKIREVIALLETLNEGWRVIAD
jgi:flagellar protein FliS